MNERIKLLAEQAGWDNHHSKFDTRIEKFAELIVRECIDIISPYAVRMSIPGEEYLHPIQEILEHFGVEK